MAQAEDRVQKYLWNEFLEVFFELEWIYIQLDFQSTHNCSVSHRIGQTKPVTIEILICSQTVDDHIWRLLKEKHETLVRIGMGKSNAMEIASVDDILNASCLSDDSLQYNSLQFENEDDDYNELVDFQFSQADDGVSGLEMEKLSTQELIVSGNRHQSETTE